MIQIMTKDGRKLRFTKEVIPLKDFNPVTDIAHQKKLTEAETHMIPEVKNGNLTMRSKNSTELAAEQKIISDRNDIIIIEQRIEDAKRAAAIERLNLTQEELDKIGE